MMMRRTSTITVLCTAAGLTAHATARAQGAPPITGQGSVQVQVQTPAQPCPPTADSLYNEAMNRMANGDDAGAAVLFGRVLELCPSHPSAAEMQRNAAQHAQMSGANAAGGAVQGSVVVQQAAPIVQPGVVTQQVAPGWSGQSLPAHNLVYGPDPISIPARVNLIIGQTLFGMTLGSFVPAMIGANNVRAEHIAGGLLLGGAVGAAGSILASLNGVTTGQSIAVNMGSAAGFGLGTSVAFLAGATNPTAVLGLMSGGIALGTIAGAVLATQRPLGGKMSYVASWIGWSTMFATHAYVGVTNLGASTSGQAVGGTLLAGLALGGIIGGVTAPFVHVSADRMGWINLSMTAGWSVVGLSSMLFAISSGGAGIAYGWGSIVGAGLGALFGVLVTRDVDRHWHEMHRQQQEQRSDVRMSRRRPSMPTQVSVAPGGVGQNPLSLTIAGTF